MPSGNELFSSLSGERMRVFRAHLRLSQEEFASAIGGTKRGIQQNESGKTAPNSKALLGMAQLGLNVNWLLTGEGPMLLSQLEQNGGAFAELDGDRLGMAIAAVDKVAAEQRIQLSTGQRGRLAVLAYQYYLTDKTELEAAAYVAQLMELMGHA